MTTTKYKGQAEYLAAVVNEVEHIQLPPEFTKIIGAVVTVQELSVISRATDSGVSARDVLDNELRDNWISLLKTVVQYTVHIERGGEPVTPDQVSAVRQEWERSMAASVVAFQDLVATIEEDA